MPRVNAGSDGECTVPNGTIMYFMHGRGKLSKGRPPECVRPQIYERGSNSHKTAWRRAVSNCNLGPSLIRVLHCCMWYLRQEVCALVLHTSPALPEAWLYAYGYSILVSAPYDSIAGADVIGFGHPSTQLDTGRRSLSQHSGQ